MNVNTASHLCFDSPERDGRKKKERYKISKT